MLRIQVIITIIWLIAFIISLVRHIYGDTISELKDRITDLEKKVSFLNDCIERIENEIKMYKKE